MPAHCFETFCQFACSLFVMFDVVLRYQPPIPAEEVKPAFDYDHEGALSVDLPYYDYDVLRITA
jgi:hypothetical protein